jgi:hypothetical protein
MRYVKARDKERRFIKENIERVVAHCFPRDQLLRDDVRNANGFVGSGFIGVPMPDKERVKILNSLFGKGQW